MYVQDNAKILKFLLDVMLMQFLHSKLTLLSQPLNMWAECCLGLWLGYNFEFWICYCLHFNSQPISDWDHYLGIEVLFTEGFVSSSSTGVLRCEQLSCLAASAAVVESFDCSPDQSVTISRFPTLCLITKSKNECTHIFETRCLAFCLAALLLLSSTSACTNKFSSPFTSLMRQEDSWFAI